MARRIPNSAVSCVRAASLVGALIASQLLAMSAAHGAVILDGKIDDDYVGHFVSVPYGSFTGRVAVIEESDAYFIAFEQDRLTKSNAYCADKKSTSNCYQTFNQLVGSDYISFRWTIGSRTIYVPVDILKVDATAPSGYSGRAGAGDGGSISGILPTAVQGRSSMDYNLNGLGWRDFANSPNFAGQPNHPYVYASQAEVRLDKTLGLLASGLDLSQPTIVPHNSPNAPMPPIAPPTIVTTSNPAGSGVAPGTAVSDTAIVTGIGGTPTGNVTFYLCNPTQVTSAGCPSGGTQIGTPINLVAGSATSAATTNTTATGTYCWRANYSGDGTYGSASHTNATTECFEVVEQPGAPLDPIITTTAAPRSDDVVPGSAVRDLAKVAGPTGAAVPTGTVTFWLCAPGVVTSAGCPTGGNQVGAAVVLDAGGDASSSTTSNTLSLGKYCWRVEYSGDDNYSPGSHTNSTSECFRTAKASPSISTVPIPSAANVGDSIFDTAQVSGGSSPTGSIKFKLYGPGDNNCTGSPVFISTVTMKNRTAKSGSYTPLEFGRYRWVATYMGDAQNRSVTGDCQAELVLVSKVLDEQLVPTGLADIKFRMMGLFFLFLAAVMFPLARRPRPHRSQRGR